MLQHLTHPRSLRGFEGHHSLEEIFHLLQSEAGLVFQLSALVMAPKDFKFLILDELIERIRLFCVLEGQVVEYNSKEDDSKGEDIDFDRVIRLSFVSSAPMDLRCHISFSCAFVVCGRGADA